MKVFGIKRPTSRDLMWLSKQMGFQRRLEKSGQIVILDCQWPPTPEIDIIMTWMKVHTHIFSLSMQCCKGKHPFIHDRKLACVIAVKKMRNTGGIMLYRKVSYRTISSKLALSFLAFLRNFWVFEFVIAWLLNGRMRKLNTQPFFSRFYSRKTINKWMDTTQIQFWLLFQFEEVAEFANFRVLLIKKL